MKTFEITTHETLPVIRKYVYTLQATNKEDAERMFREGKYETLSYIKEDDKAYEITETEIQDIAEVNQLTYNPLTKGYRIAYNSYHNRKETMTIQVIDKTNGSKFDVNHPEVTDIETAKSFLIDYNYPFFTAKTKWDDYEFIIVGAE